MSRSLPRRYLSVLALATAAFACACVSTRPYATLSERAEPLRTQFNADAGRVRLIILVAPT